ncbi:MAG: 50S ribosomal protein L35 [Candidatus Komeilibacteria bacterium]|nr:50S ribosomal protein L35 [Candidatus Komeilibacteria bacterium]
MPKLKTNKGINKRIKITKNRKMKIKAGGQNHFNARERGNTTRNKRRDNTLSAANTRGIDKMLPYS